MFNIYYLSLCYDVYSMDVYKYYVIAVIACLNW